MVLAMEARGAGGTGGGGLGGGGQVPIPGEWVCGVCGATRCLVHAGLLLEMQLPTGGGRGWWSGWKYGEVPGGRLRSW